MSSVCRAARHGNTADLQSLLRARGNVEDKDGDGWTALIYAAREGHVECIRLLLEASADVKAVDDRGRTALIRVAWKGHEECIRPLLDAGSDVNTAMNDGLTALIYAAKEGHEECTRLLLDAHADVNAAMNNGYTALIYAAKDGHEECTRLLLEARADVEAKSVAGSTALEFAERSGHSEIVALLKAAAEVAAKVVEPNAGYPASSKVVAPASGRFITLEDEEVSILPTTKWEEIEPTCSLLEELRTNPHIRAACPEIDVIAADVEEKYAGELAHLKSLKDMLQRVGQDGAHAILAYTYDLGEQEGNLYFEMNKSLRQRKSRVQMMKSWGVFVHYALKGMASLKPYQGVVFRGMPNRKYIEEHYEQGRSIEWGAFSSTSTSSQQAIGFMKDTNNGVLLKIKVKSGRVLGRVSFFPSEGEVLLSPKCRFTVISEEPYYNPDLKVYMLDLVEPKDVFQS